MSPFTSQLPEDRIPYRELFEANPQPMWVYDRKSLQFLMVNRAAIARYGYSRDDFSRMTIEDIRPPEDVPALHEHLNHLSEGVRSSSGWRHRTSDGEIIDVELSSHDVEFAGRAAVLVQVHDVTARRAAQRERRLLSEALKAAANVVVITDREGVIQWVNSAFARITGYTPEEAVGRTPRDLIKSGKQDESFYHNLWRTILAGEVWRSQIVNRRKDGTEYVADETITPVRAEDGLISHFISVHEDITQRVAVEQDLQSRVKELRTLYSATELLQKTDLPLDERLERLVQIVRTGWSDPEICEVRITIRGATIETPGFRETPWILPAEINLRGAVIGRLEVVLTAEPPVPDEDPFRQEERDLLNSLARAVGESLERQRLDILSREIREVIYILDPDGTVRFSTPSIEQTAGYTREEFEGTSALDLVHEEDRDRVKAQLDEIFDMPGMTARAEYRIMNAKGEIRHVESVARNLLDHPGVGGILVTSRDVSERVELEGRMHESQRLESIGRLAGGIAHDFNNLLTVIRGQTDLLLLDLDASDPTTADLELIQSAADRAATLTGQLLAFSRDQVLQPKVVVLGEVVRRTIGLVERLIGSDISVESDLPGDRPAIKVDPAQLEQVIFNLAVNARDAMPDGGVLRLRTFSEEIDESTAAARDVQPGSYTVLEVSDTGIGMNAETQASVFEPFFTTKRDIGGTGLGLAMAHGVVKQSGGAIDVESAPGEGTTFFLRFPAADQEPDHILPSDDSAVLEEESAGTVLVIEDDASVRRLVLRILGRAGLTVMEAEGAEEGLEILERGTPVDLVLTDIGLQGMSGRTLISHVRERHPGLPIVIMSGYAAAAKEGELPAEIPLVQKPFTPSALVAVVQRAMTAGA